MLYYCYLSGERGSSSILAVYGKREDRHRVAQIQWKNGANGIIHRDTLPHDGT